MPQGWRPGALVLLAGAALAAAAPQPPPHDQRAPLTSGATAIVIDAVVRDGKGRPVTDLRREDFEVLEDGVPQRLGDVTVVMPGPDRRHAPVVGRGETPAAEGTRDAPALPGFTAIVFDRLSPEARNLAYKGALACLDTLQAGDYVGVFLSDLHLTTIQPYTNDREKLRAAIKDLASRATSIFDRQSTANIGGDRDARGNPMPGDADPSVPVVASPESVGRPVDQRSGPGREILAVQNAAWEIMARDQQGYATTNALLAITSGLGSLPGRKTVVFFAEGLAIPPAVLPHFRNVVANANRGNVSVYTIDAAGLRVHSTDAVIGREVHAMAAAGMEGSSSLALLERNEDVLRKDPRTSLTLLAEQTGGFLVNNTNDLARAFRDVDADRRFHYLLTYTPSNPTFNGEWRTVTVKVPARRVTVRARSGYLAVRAPTETPLLAHEGGALAALERTPAPDDLPVRARGLVFPDGGQPRVVVLAATDGAALRFVRDDQTHRFRTDFTMLARVVDASRDVVSTASQPYRLSGPADQLEQAQRGEILFFRQPTLPPGSYTLEVAVHDALANRAGVRRVPFVVPIAPDSLQVSSLVIVQRAERVPAAERQPTNPLYVDEMLLYPNLGEPIHRSREGIGWYISLAEGSGAAPQATVEVLRDGQVVADTQTVVTFPAPDATLRRQYRSQLPVENLAAGRYTLRVTVTQSGRREVREADFVLRD